MQEGQSEESLIESTERSDEGNRPTRHADRPEGKCCQISPLNLVCISHAFSAWGDRMWHFAIGLYLVELTPGSLRLTAIYQLISTLSIIIFGPLVGDWVDANARLKVAQVSLIIQNVAVIICGVLLLIMLELDQHLQHPVITLLEALIIIIGSVADLSSIGTRIAVEKDWVVVIAGSDKSLLASTNAILRRIDLCCKILAPILVGQIMTYISKVAGVLFLAGWNVVSVFGEYFLLWKVFQSVTGLSQKVFDTRHQGNAEDGSSVDLSPQGSWERLDWMENEDPASGQTGAESLVPAVSITRARQRPLKPSLFVRFKKRVLTFKTAWHIYFRQSVARPGLALASLYFTVISFGAITTGYAYTQCLSESILSIVRGVGSLFGVLATFVFPRLRNSIGVVRVSCLLLCVAAVFAPGSPFFLLPRNAGQVSLPQCKLSDVKTSTPTPGPGCFNQDPTIATFSVPRPSNLQLKARLSNSSSSMINFTVRPTSSLIKSSFISLANGSQILQPSTARFSISIKPKLQLQHNSLATAGRRFSYISIGLLLAGIVTSRLGLWLSDLNISQLFQEAVPEQERGIVAGMQNSFNSVLSLAMFFLVIALPKPEHFGLLALMSVCAVGTGGLLYASFAYNVRGHLFHFEKVRNFCGGSAAVSEPVPTSPDDLDLEDEEEAMIRGVLSTRNENFKY
ncbi:hypothetical protein OS493_030516 [Desmophyllum pertusum]|uniref:Solute carrier family 40 protein n=1 Tax=Desmophyllum pertusum TaxID=174260 RepID=A0A9W9YJU2_9CNID|nr:hypothetical protein OS493_030516 [Desmophyllum pertusum]